MDDDEDYQEWESGPYCRHWGDPSDCKECWFICYFVSKDKGCHHLVRDHHWENPGCSECGCNENHDY